MPRWDVRERHHARVRAPAAAVYAARRSADLGRHPVVRALLGLRALPAALARAGWNFTVADDADGACVLTTETRVLAGPGAGRWFRLYWTVIRPGSGLIRRMMRGAIRREAEAAGGAATA